MASTNTVHWKPHPQQRQGPWEKSTHWHFRRIRQRTVEVWACPMNRVAIIESLWVLKATQTGTEFLRIMDQRLQSSQGAVDLRGNYSLSARYWHKCLELVQPGWYGAPQRSTASCHSQPMPDIFQHRVRIITSWNLFLWILKECSTSSGNRKAGQLYLLFACCSSSPFRALCIRSSVTRCCIIGCVLT